jgi:hypothetical protein
MKSKRIKFWALSLLVFAVLGALAIPQYSKVRPENLLKAHVNSLRHITQGIVLYAEEHDGEFPPSLDALIAYDARMKDQRDKFTRGEIYYIRPTRKLKDSLPNDPILISTFKVGTAVAYVDGTAVALKPEWEKQKNEN